MKRSNRQSKSRVKRTLKKFGELKVQVLQKPVQMRNVVGGEVKSGGIIIPN